MASAYFSGSVLDTSTATPRLRSFVQPRPKHGLLTEGTAKARGLLLVLPRPDLEDVATPRAGTQSGGTWLTGRGEAHLVTALVQRVDAEHDFFLGGDGVHLLWRFRFVELDRPRLARGVLRRPGEAEGVTLKDDRRLLHLVFGQALSVLHRHDEIPSALKPVQVRLWRRRRRRLTVARPDQQADGCNHEQSRFHHVQRVDPCVAEGKLRATSIPSSRSVCCPLRPLRTRIALPPC